jgi:cell division protein FtsW (lipid II flippase)
VEYFGFIEGLSYTQVFLGTAIVVLVVCVIYAFLKNVDTQIFIEIIIKLVSLIVSAEYEIKGNKRGDERKSMVCMNMKTLLNEKEEEIVDRHGGIIKLIEMAFSIVRPIIRNGRGR